MGMSAKKSSRVYKGLLALVTLMHLLVLGTRLNSDWAEPVGSKITVTKPVKVRLENLRPPAPNKQIVESEDGKSVQDRVLDDAYLSDKNRYFDRESQARNIGTFHKGGGKGKGKRADMNLSDLGAFEKDHDPYKVAAKAYSEKFKKKPGTSGNEGPARGISSSSDHLLNIPPGDFTYLNTVEYKYYGFFHRIRQKLEQFWGRTIQEKAEFLMENGRSIASGEEHITALEITLSEAGEITEIVIKGTSGVKELDDAAIESFNEAGPFPNPPKDLIVGGQVTIEWGFVVKS